jgi:hypothetical protein
LDTYAEQLRLKLPVAPPGVLDGYMRYMPWVFIIFGILGILATIAGLGLATFLGPLLILFGGAAGVGYGGALFLALIFGLLSSVLGVVGGWMMVQHKATGWWILALGLAVSFLNDLAHGSIFALIIVALVAYVHLQVKPNYH